GPRSARDRSSPRRRPGCSTGVSSGIWHLKYRLMSLVTLEQQLVGALGDHDFHCTIGSRRAGYGPPRVHYAAGASVGVPAYRAGIEMTNVLPMPASLLMPTTSPPRKRASCRDTERPSPLLPLESFELASACQKGSNTCS